MLEIFLKVQEWAILITLILIFFALFYVCWPRHILRPQYITTATACFTVWGLHTFNAPVTVLNAAILVMGTAVACVIMPSVLRSFGHFFGYYKTRKNMGEGCWANSSRQLSIHKTQQPTAMGCGVNGLLGLMLLSVFLSLVQVYVTFTPNAIGF